MLERLSDVLERLSDVLERLSNVLERLSSVLERLFSVLERISNALERLSNVLDLDFSCLLFYAPPIYKRNRKDYPISLEFNSLFYVYSPYFFSPSFEIKRKYPPQ